MVQLNEKVPEFTLPATGNRVVSLNQSLGKKNVVLFFYPQDWTPV